MIEFIIILFVLPASVSLYKYILVQNHTSTLNKENIINKYDYDFLLMNS